MTCANCGFPAAMAGGFCSRCGARQAAVAGVPTYAIPYAPRVQQHVGRLGMLWAIFAVYHAITGMIGLFFARAFVFGFGPWGWPAHNIPFGHLVHFGIGSLFVGTLIDAAIAYGLLQRQRWARPLAIVFGVFALFKIPFGTALGIYTLWVLAPLSSRIEYDAISE